MNKQWIQYGAGIFVGVAIYRLLLKNEDWVRSLFAAAFTALAVSLAMFFYFKRKGKKSA
jgi:multisubunit Na+/H+ antiporter MnhC subunit